MLFKVKINNKKNWNNICFIHNNYRNELTHLDQIWINPFFLIQKIIQHEC